MWRDVKDGNNIFISEYASRDLRRHVTLHSYFTQLPLLLNPSGDLPVRLTLWVVKTHVIYIYDVLEGVLWMSENKSNYTLDICLVSSMHFKGQTLTRRPLLRYDASGESATRFRALCAYFAN